jgi:hypothetical protein
MEACIDWASDKFEKSAVSQTGERRGDQKRSLCEQHKKSG